MIDAAQTQAQAATAQTTAPANASLSMKMVRSDRMAGSVAVWSSSASSMPATATKSDTGSQTKSRSFASVIMDAISGEPDKPAAASKPFGFHDLINIINPLQHIPVVEQIYRHFTGDTITPAMQVLGDTLYGGPIGGGISLANAALTHETGKNIVGTAIAMVRGESPTYQTASNGEPLNPKSTSPIQDIEPAGGDTKTASAVASLPGSVISMADLGNGSHRVTERISASSDRMAGTMVRISTADGPIPASYANAAAGAPQIASAASTTASARHSAFRSLHLNA